MFDIKNIIVPTDFSKLSQSAFEYAKDLAEMTDATVHLIHVLDINPPFPKEKDFDSTGKDLALSNEDEAKKRLNIAAEDITEDSEIRVVQSLRKGIDYEEIVNYAKDVDANIIVIATHSRTGVLHNLLGSVAEKVIRYSKCPVLVIPPEEDL